MTNKKTQKQNATAGHIVGIGAIPVTVMTYVFVGISAMSTVAMTMTAK